MANAQAHTIVRYIRSLIDPEAVRDLTDGQLLERFVGQHQEAAFATLVQRHARLVMGVCRHILHHEHDAEDAFQATFLVLARKAAAIRKGDSVGSWLYGVAYRIAMRAKKTLTKRRQREAQLASRAPEKPVSQAALHELQARLDEEVNRLPAKYRTPFILCCLTGKSREEVAQELGWQKGTVSSRVAKARTLLRQRLARRGVVLSAALCASALGQDAASAAVTATLAAHTVRGSLQFPAGQTAGTISARAVGWAEGVMRAMVLTKLKAVAGLILVLGILVGGAGLTAHQTLVGQTPPSTSDEGKTGEKPVESPREAAGNRAGGDANGDPLPPGALVRLGETRFRPGARTTHLAFSPDGKKLASWGNFLYHHDRLSLWDTATGKELRTELMEEGCLADIAWCADGRGFAILTPAQRRATTDFLVWEFTAARAKNPAPAKSGWRFTGVIVGGQESPEYYGPFAIAPNGKWLAAYHAGGKIKPEATLFQLGEASTARRRKIARTIKDLPTHVGTLAFSRDNRLLFAFSHKDPGATTETVAVYETANGQKQNTLTVPMALHQGTRKTFALSHDGSLLALGLEDGSARVIEVKTGRQFRSVARHLMKGRGRPWGGVSTVAFSPDGKRLVTGGRDNALKVWDVGTGREVFHLAGHHSWPEAAAFTADGKRLATSGQDSLIRLWDVATGKELVPPKGHYHTIWGLAVSRDGRLAQTNGWDGTARLWDLRTGAQLRRFSQDSDCPAVLPDDGTVLTRWKGKWRCWDRTTGKEKRLPPGLAAARGIASLSGDGRTLLTADEKAVTLWAWPGGKRLLQIQAKKRVQKVMVTPDGRTLLTLEEGGVVTRWDRKTGKNLGPLPLRVGHYSDLVQLTNDGLLVAAGAPQQRAAQSSNGTDILFCDVQARQIIREFPIVATTPGVFYLESLAVSGDGRTVAVGQSDGNAALYEVATGKRRRVLRGHREGIPNAAFTPDGRLVTTSLDHTALVWDVTLRGRGPASSKPLAEKELPKLWEALGRPEPAPAFQALAQLAGDPKTAVALIRKHLPPARGSDDGTLDRIVKDLENKQFKVRRKASSELDALGEAVVEGVRRRLAQAQSLELRTRLDAFLKKYDRAEPTPDRLREIRAFQLLEEFATPEALGLLRDLARGNGNARRTREAVQALQRCRQIMAKR